ncbi:MAG: hypothetical protein L0H74_00700 [Brachybacterium sp.]|nr:hypothetical protein [Brachybacterium sp.]
MSVAVAARVFGSEILLALIRYYRASPGTTQQSAAEALSLSQQLVSSNTRILTDAELVVGAARGRRGGRYHVDEARLQELLKALEAYLVD